MSVWLWVFFFIFFYWLFGLKLSDWESGGWCSKGCECKIAFSSLSCVCFNIYRYVVFFSLSLAEEEDLVSWGINGLLNRPTKKKTPTKKWNKQNQTSWMGRVISGGEGSGDHFLMFHLYIHIYIPIRKTSRKKMYIYILQLYIWQPFDDWLTASFDTWLICETFCLHCLHMCVGCLTLRA